jgi:hypothetical protein
MNVLVSPFALDVWMAPLIGRSLWQCDYTPPTPACAGPAGLPYFDGEAQLANANDRFLKAAASETFWFAESAKALRQLLPAKDLNSTPVFGAMPLTLMTSGLTAAGYQPAADVRVQMANAHVTAYDSYVFSDFAALRNDSGFTGWLELQRQQAIESSDLVWEAFPVEFYLLIV